MSGEDYRDDGDLSDDQQRAVDSLTVADVAAIDSALLAAIGERWRKVAMVVAMVMGSPDEPGRRVGVPDVFYAMRVRELVRQGLVESQGNLRRMRYSEVRRRTRADHGNGPLH